MAGWAPPRLEDFILTDKLGSGTYATVYKAYRKRNTREVVAIKCVSKKSLNKASVENLLTEIEILKTVHHPHILELKDFQWDRDYIFLITEYCAGGDLSHFIRSRRILPEKIVQIFLQQIDFGFAQHMVSQDESQSLRGSPLYMAPEMICSRHYDARVDLWSVGVILYEALFGRAPFASRSFSELEEKIRSARSIELPSRPRVSPECRDLLQRLLERDPDCRISFPDFFNHPFVDLEHMPCAESLQKATSLVAEAVEKDGARDYSAALSLYCRALEYFVPSLHYETDIRRKEAIRSKVRQYISRAEELKVLVSSSNKSLLLEGTSLRELLKEMSQDKPRLFAALDVASAAVAKDEEGMAADALDLYQQSLGELILMLSAEPVGRRRELLHAEIQTLMKRAEFLKEQMKTTDWKNDSLGNEMLSESVRGSCSLQ
ncbi:serine/threonine-protein kinase ULK3 isoform X2 [Lithobates pipiens]